MWNTAVFRLPRDFDPGTNDARLPEPALLIHNRRLRTQRHNLHTVADPFLFAHNGALYLFVEEKRSYRRGLISCYKTRDLEHWEYLGEALSEPHHLSYPFVFAVDDAIYMLPESGASGRVTLYEALEFPLRWQRRSTLLEGDYVDSSIHRRGELFWLLASKGYDELHAFSSAALDQPWSPHPHNPVVKDSRTGRSAGGLIAVGDHTYRLSQDCSRAYGSGICLNKLEDLTDENFRETLVKEQLFADQFWWNSHGSHHLSIAEFEDELVLAIDGKSMDYRINRVMGLFFRMFRAL